VQGKNVWKKIVGKKCENVFLYSHEYRDQKMRGKKLAKQFFQKHPNSASKKCLEKNLRKIVRKRFLYSHEYRDQKMGGKTRETIFQETQEYCEQKVLGKNRRKKVRKKFLYIHTNIVN